MTADENRRPLKVRDATVVQRFARFLARRDITPNQISVLSVVFAACAAALLFAMPAQNDTFHVSFAILAALSIQLRLLCNLFDGMVAVEGGKATSAGELFNDIPDRVADPLILVAAGFATGETHGAYLGFTAGILAVMTAYVRTLATSIGAPTNFCGPMAKQHRMATVTIACLVTALEPLWDQRGVALLVALCIICVGALITAARRARAAYIYLESKNA